MRESPSSESLAKYSGLEAGEFAAQCVKLLHQLKRQRDTRQIDLEVTLQAQCRAGASERGAGEAPLLGLDRGHAEHAFFHELDDVCSVHGAQATQLVDAENGIFFENLSSQSLLSGSHENAPRCARGLKGTASASAR